MDWNVLNTMGLADHGVLGMTPAQGMFALWAVVMLAIWIPFIIIAIKNIDK